MRLALKLLMGIALCCSTAEAQSPDNNQGRVGGEGFQRPGGRQGGRRMGGGSRPGSPGSSTLEGAGLKIGQAMPDLSIHDAEGNEFRIADLKGKHSVVVFGCLT